MHIYSSLGLTQNLAAQAGSPIKKAQNQKLVEANNKLDAKPNNKANTSTASFKDTLTLSKQALGFKEIAKKYDLTNVSFKELHKMVDELSAANLISSEEATALTMHAHFYQMKFLKKGNEIEMTLREDTERINFTKRMNDGLEFKLSEGKSNYDEIKRLKDAIAVLDKLTALRGQSYA